VRAKAMAMHSSKDISDATAIVFNELSKLGIEMDRCGIATYNDTPIMEVWSTPLSPEDKQVIDVVNGDLDYRFNSLLVEVHEAWENGQDFFSRTYEGDEVKEYYTHLLEAPDYHFPVADEYPEKHVANMCYFKQGFIFIWTQFELTEEVKELLKRFTKEFSRTYTRYLDLKKAEAQAREAQVETSLERVRAMAMAMRSSKDISGAVAVVFNELTRLGIEMERCGIGIFDVDSPIMELWSTPLSQKNRQVVKVITGKVNSNFHPMTQESYRAWKERKDFYSYELKGDEVNKYYELLEKEPGYNFPKVTNFPERQILNSFNVDEGGIFVYSREKLTEGTKQIISRFSKVFSLTYKRYLDIVKAEAQAREAQVEASLERVRAKAMAMHSSKDISGATVVIFNELKRLGINMIRAGIVIFNETFIGEVWSTRVSPKDNQVIDIVTGNLDFNIHPMLQHAYRNWKNNNDFSSYELKGDEIIEYYKLLKKQPNYHFPEVSHYPTRQILNTFYINEGGIFVYSGDLFPEETKQIVHRFSKVFSHTYKRYLDIVKAEAQAREAQIEASLERVRAKAMAMHSSKDISDATAVVFDELTRLGIEMERCGIVILDKTPVMEVWSTLLSPENKKVIDVINGKINSDIHVLLQEVYKAWIDKKEFFAYKLVGDEVQKYYDKLEKQPGYHFPKIANYPDQQIANSFYFNEGFVFAYTLNHLSDNDKKVFQRFTNVFSLTYRRYQDLIIAEAQAREAIKQASLNRVRGEIASMRNAEDLKRITPVIWRELKELDVLFIRCGVFIIDEENKKTRAYLSTPSGKALAVLNLKFDENKLTKNTVDYWRKNQVYKEHWNKEDFINWLKSMMKTGQVKSAEEYQGSASAPESLHLHFIPFKQGMFYVGNTSPLSQEELDLVNALTKSFSVAYARYEDFNNLETAKEEIEKTLDELKAAQTQLVHSEKMASLGELTAGIAHEIQNPLNFVNNFSELSIELLVELKEEMENGNNDEVKALAEDVIQNLEKINHHGKRADAIVKGMLQHSRTSNGIKEPTDINALADEYLRLSYHGLRAKDKSFNADFKTEFDESLPKINVIPQDIGRVLLNLINNAFFAVSERNKKGEEGYKPIVSVSTAKVDDKLEIKVADNGNGIPENIKEKIFQPFFTTKPTGQGTGLGLSLSYDIVKAHGGELKVETKIGEGSTFIIQLPLKNGEL
jgi:signal transduction histidine kinase